MGPRKLGLTSGMGQCLADDTPRVSRSGQASVTYVRSHKRYTQSASQTVRPEGRGVVRHRSSRCADVSSDIGESDSGARPREVDPRPHTSYQLGRSVDHKGSMRVVWMTRSGVTRVKSHRKRYGP